MFGILEQSLYSYLGFIHAFVFECLVVFIQLTNIFVKNVLHFTERKL